MTFDHIFDHLDIRAEPFAICEIFGTCHVALKPDAAVTLHYILSGEGRIAMRGLPTMKVAAGSLAMIPSLSSHEVLNDGTQIVPGPACKPAELNLTRVLKAASGTDTSSGRLVALCAHLSVGLAGATDVVNLIREPLVAQAPEGSALRGLVEVLLREVADPRLGSRALIRALLLQAVIEMLRTRMLAQDGALHWMAALSDPLIWNALRVMLDDPGRPHSVESLADEAGISRSAFARRFAEAYGAGPMELLRALRMRKAGTLLSNTDQPVKRIAEIVGFASRSAFSRQFEAATGQSPGEFRKVAKAK